jgi:hypothetical protein
MGSQMKTVWRLAIQQGSVLLAMRIDLSHRATPNPSIEGTSTSGLRPLAAAPHVKR